MVAITINGTSPFPFVLSAFQDKSARIDHCILLCGSILNSGLYIVFSFPLHSLTKSFTKRKQKEQYISVERKTNIDGYFCCNMDHTKAPPYSETPSAEELTANSRAAAQRRVIPIIQVASEEIKQGVSLGFGSVNAVQTLKTLKKYNKEEQKLFTGLLRKNLQERNILLLEEKGSLHIIWDHKCTHVQLHKDAGTFGLKMSVHDGVVMVDEVLRDGLGIYAGNVIEEIDGKNICAMPFTEVISLLKSLDDVVLTIRLSHSV